MESSCFRNFSFQHNIFESSLLYLSKTGLYGYHFSGKTPKRQGTYGGMASPLMLEVKCGDWLLEMT